MAKEIKAGDRRYSKSDSRGDVERSIDRQYIRKDVEHGIRREIEYLVRMGVIRDER